MNMVRKRVRRWLSRLFVGACLVVTLFGLTLQWLVFPNIGHFRGDVEAMLSGVAGNRVTIGSIETAWAGFLPRLSLRNISVGSREDAQKLRIERIDAVFRWNSLLYLEPRLSSLDFVGPSVFLRRDVSGAFFVAGVALRSEKAPVSFGGRMLQDGKVSVTDATVRWQDERRSPAVLELPKLDLEIGLSSHRVTLRATTAGNAIAKRIDLRSDLPDSDSSVPRSWTGRISGEIEDADFATLAKWIDLPVELSRGRGDIRFSADLDQGDVAAVETDFSLSGLQVRLATDRPVLRFDRVKGHIQGNRAVDGYEMAVRADEIKSADLSGAVDARYSVKQGTRLGSLELDANLTHIDAASLWRYVPPFQSSKLSDWFRASLTKGSLEDVSLKINGDLKKFPFPDGAGVFRMTARVSGGDLRYAGDWPPIRNMSGRLVLDGRRMTFDVVRARIQDIAVGPVHVEMPDCFAGEQPVLVNGEARSSASRFLGFVKASPLGKEIGDIDGVMLGGAGKLALAMQIPLRHPDKTSVTGKLQLLDGSLRLGADLPALEEINGYAEFDGSNMSAKSVQARLFGKPVKFALATDADHGLSITAFGVANAAYLKGYAPPSVLDHVSGETDWTGALRILRSGESQFRFASDFRGVGISLPEPFSKSTDQSLPTFVEGRVRRMSRSGSGASAIELGGERQDYVDINLGKLLQAQLHLQSDSSERGVRNGWVRLGDGPKPVPEDGKILVAINFPRIDLDSWREILGESSLRKERREEVGRPLVAKLANFRRYKYEIRADDVALMGQSFHKLELAGSDLCTNIKSQEVIGQVCLSDLDGVVKSIGRFSRFNIEGLAQRDGSSAQLPASLPDIDLIFDRFVYGGKDLGEIKVLTKSDGAHLGIMADLQNSDGGIHASVGWRRGTDVPRVSFGFLVEANSVERFLSRFGFAGAFRGGKAKMIGNLSWEGTPFGMDYPSLDGTCSLDAGSGRINKLEPGFGRLLGVLGMQTLRRRLSLDVSDIFNEGLAFDRIRGDVKLSQGVLTTEDMVVQGPAARMALRGSVDLPNEFQSLTVRVWPAVGGTLATGAIIANPAVGGAAWAFAKALGDPLEHLLVYDYRVVGSLVAPLVEKIAAASPATGNR